MGFKARNSQSADDKATGHEKRWLDSSLKLDHNCCGPFITKPKVLSCL